MRFNLEVNRHTGFFLVGVFGLVACASNASKSREVSGGDPGLSSGGRGFSAETANDAALTDNRPANFAGGGAGSRAAGGKGGPNGSGGRVGVGQAGGAPSGAGGKTGGAGAAATGGGAGADAGDIGQLIDSCPGAKQTIVVAADGSGQHRTIQAAINSIGRGNSQLVEVDIKAGTYDEQVTVDKPFVCLAGENPTTTIITNTNGTNIIEDGTVRVTANDFSASNLTFRNSAPEGSGQAVALMAQGQRQQFFNCRFVSYQDTLFANEGTQYFRNCYIQGNTDYIFGYSTAVFDRCTINNVSEGTAIAAPSTPQGSKYGFVFIGGLLTADPTTSQVRANHVRLGRPWKPFGAAAFISVSMGAHIAADGWTTMDFNSLATARFWEYKSTGAGANPTHQTRSTRQLSDSEAAAYTVKNVLSPWTPTYYSQ
jgi:pectin methylesterase-like acyl-CoA thioesterase